MTNTQTTQVSGVAHVRLAENQLERMRRLATSADRTLGAEIRRAVRDYLEAKEPADDR